jgi:hypothetical protein
MGRDDLRVVRPSPSRIVASPLAEARHFYGGGTTSASSAHYPESWRLRLRRPCTLMGRDDLRVVRTSVVLGRDDLRVVRISVVASGFIPRLCPWVRSVLAIRPGVKPVATSASGGTTSASSALQPSPNRGVSACGGLPL